MSKREIKEHYAAKMEAAETAFEKSMINAELNHKLQMIENGIDPFEQMRRNSEFECINCGS
jgi:hypothetical protein